MTVQGSATSREMVRAPATQLAKPRRAPGPSRWQSLSTLRALRRDRLGFFRDLSERYGSIVRVPLGPMTFFLVNDPDALERVLRRNYKNYRKAPLLNADRMIALGRRGLLTADGDLWRGQRKVSQPAFTRSALDGYVSEISRLAEDELAQWPGAAQDGVVDVLPLAARFAIRVASSTLLGCDLDHRVDEIRDATITIVDTLTDRMSGVFKAPWGLPLPAHRRCRRAIRALDSIVYEVIQRRRREGLQGTDILSRLLRAYDEGGDVNEASARDQAVTFLIAGSESSSASFAWTLQLVAQHPDVLQRVKAEVDEVLGERTPEAGDLCKLSYTLSVVQESMRMYPPSWLFDRQAVRSDELAGYRIPRGSVILMLPYLLHRSPDLWSRPEVFDPSRFEAENIAKRHDFSYLPFSGGPRKCIGDRFSLIESTVLLAMVAQRWRLEAQSPEPPPSIPSVALRPSRPIRLRLVCP